jgi:hypothetical protein
MKRIKKTSKAAHLIIDTSSLQTEKKEIQEEVKEKEAEVRKEEIITVVVEEVTNIKTTLLKRGKVNLIKSSNPHLN